MADYYPLIARAVEGLAERTPEARRAVYDRARTALLDQLRSLDPPLSEADITRERLSLDEAIGRAERGFQDDAPPPAPKPPPRAPRPSTPAPEPDPWPEATPAGREPDGALARPSEPRPAGAEPEPMRLPEEASRERPRLDTVGPADAGRVGRGRMLVLALALFAVIGGIAVAAWLLRDKPGDLPRQDAVAEAPPPPESEGKISDRVAGERAPAPAAGGATPAPAAPGTRADLPVAQRAILYEENQLNPQAPKATSARALWRLDNLNAGQGQPLETVVRATVEVPEAGIVLNLTLRRNLDPTLPASHTVELSFATPPGDANRVIRDVGLLQLKNEESVRGTPVAGLPVPVKENLFLIGLSNIRSDIDRNADLLLRRNWIDLPIRFASGQRAILSFEKGVPGETVMRDAFQQWQ